VSIKKIKTKEEFKDFVKSTKKIKGYKNPIGFGIARVDKGQLNRDKILQASFAFLNWSENFGSAAVFIAALNECEKKVDFSKSEQIFEIDKR